jgi:hypothetical protein
MTFAAREESRHHGAPVEVLLFRHGAGPDAYFAYTTAEQAITLGEGEDAITYAPLPIGRGPTQSSGTLDKTTLELRMPRTAQVAELFLVWPPTEPVSLVIRQGHVGDGDAEFLAVWSGRVLSAGFEGSHAVLSCEPITTSLRRNGLRRHYQRGCPHPLYSVGEGLCNADREAATVATTAEAINARTLTVPADWPGLAEASQFLGGMVEWTTAAGNVERRSIIRVSGGGVNLLLSGGIVNLAVDDPVSVIKGCPHDMPGCTAVHDNIHNYGGQDWIPANSPFGSRNEFY